MIFGDPARNMLLTQGITHVVDEGVQVAPLHQRIGKPLELE